MKNKKLTTLERAEEVARSIYGPQNEGRVLNTSYVRDRSDDDDSYEGTAARSMTHGHDDQGRPGRWFFEPDY